MKLFCQFIILFPFHHTILEYFWRSEAHGVNCIILDCPQPMNASLKYSILFSCHPTMDEKLHTMIFPVVQIVHPHQMNELFHDIRFPVHHQIEESLQPNIVLL